MVTDTLFHSEKKGLRKIALLFTIPCAILPVLFAASVFMSIPDGGLLFAGDFILFTPVYVMYVYGLLLSRQTHLKSAPLLVFMLHATSLVLYILWKQASWLSYTSILSIIATSAINQYYRFGVFSCTDECTV